MPRESTLGGPDVTKIEGGNPPSNIFRRYHQNPYDISFVKCGAFRQGVAVSIVFAVLLSQGFSLIADSEEIVQRL
jgi:hypothetical protein